MQVCVQPFGTSPRPQERREVRKGRMVAMQQQQRPCDAHVLDPAATTRWLGRCVPSSLVAVRVMRPHEVRGHEGECDSMAQWQQAMADLDRILLSVCVSEQQ